MRFVPAIFWLVPRRVGMSAASRTRLEEGKTFFDMANELVEIGLFDPKEAEE